MHWYFKLRNSMFSSSVAVVVEVQLKHNQLQYKTFFQKYAPVITDLIRCTTQLLYGPVNKQRGRGLDIRNSSLQELT